MSLDGAGRWIPLIRLDGVKNRGALAFYGLVARRVGRADGHGDLGFGPRADVVRRVINPSEASPITLSLAKTGRIAQMSFNSERIITQINLSGIGD